MIGDGKGAEIEDAAQFKWLWVAGRQLRRIFSEIDHRAAHHAVLYLPCILCI